MGQVNRKALGAVAVVLMVFIMLMQNHLDPKRNSYQPGKLGNVEIGTEFIAATLIGLKEVVAGLLWVRTDEFFHTGNYEAIIPMVRIVTWLDPKQMDVYDTGSWHLSYNFTDSQERSDRRYIPASKALLREGIENNPNVFDLFFSLGWLNFQKVQDYNEAAKWFSEANTKGSIDPATGEVRPAKAQLKDRPQFVGHSLAHAYEKSGDLDKAIAQWKQNIADNKMYANYYAKDKSNQTMVDVAQRNLLQCEISKQVRAKIRPVKDVHFEGYWQRLGPRKFRVWGHIGLPNGTRVRLRLTDKNYQEENFQKFTYGVNTKQTILIDDIYVRDYTFDRTIDIQRDSNIYPLKGQDYELSLSFNPLTASDYIQGAREEDTLYIKELNSRTNLNVKPDVQKEYGEVGSKGEGLADQKYLVVKDGVRMIEKVIPLKRSDLT